MLDRAAIMDIDLVQQNRLEQQQNRCRQQQWAKNGVLWMVKRSGSLAEPSGQSCSAAGHVLMQIEWDQSSSFPDISMRLTGEIHSLGMPVLICTTNIRDSYGASKACKWNPDFPGKSHDLPWYFYRRLLVIILTLPLFALWHCQSQAWIKEEGDANYPHYHTVLLNWKY